ncbi:translation elongation factor Ts [soil metagenome]
MAAFTAKDVSSLRQRTGAGMMDCKKALEQNDGDVEKAVEWLRTKGIARAESRAGRVASEGKIVALTSPDGKKGVLAELNSETDFVARNDAFGQTAYRIANAVHDHKETDGVVANAEGSPIMAVAFGESANLAEALKMLTGTIGENIVLRRYAKLGGDGAVGNYVHHTGKVAALVELSGAHGDEAQKLASTIAEHIAAGVPSVPVSVTREEVPAELVDRERRIFSEQAAASGKPENIVQKMVEGRIDKFYKEITLLDQPWVRDDSKTIRDLLKGLGANVSIRRFARFQMGLE